MIAGQALGDVVQQDGAIEHRARLDALDDFGGKRVFVLAMSPRSMAATLPTARIRCSSTV